ncbi:MAG: hypothetical protein ACPGVP_08530, partial [Thiolinea sp.]
NSDIEVDQARLRLAAKAEEAHPASEEIKLTTKAEATLETEGKGLGAKTEETPGAEATRPDPEAVHKSENAQLNTEASNTRETETDQLEEEAASKTQETEFTDGATSKAEKAQLTTENTQNREEEAADKPNKIPNDKKESHTAKISNESSSVTDFDHEVTDAMRPAGLNKPHNGKADDLKQIKGIGPVIEQTLNTEGIYHFQQIADFSSDNVRWVNKTTSFPGRIEREDWIGQAKALASGQNYEGYLYDPESVTVTDDMRPEKLTAPNQGKADELQQIKGIGPVIEKRLNSEGIYHYHQIAAFTPQNTMWVDREIAFPGRIHREDWIGQARALMSNQQYTGYGLQAVAEGDNSNDINENMRPQRSKPASGTKGDDLKAINGIGPVIEETLNIEGIHYYHQIADFTKNNIRWVNHHIAFPGRIEREDWVGQAKRLVTQQTAIEDSGGISDDMKPPLLDNPLPGGADDLKRIKGIGHFLEKTLQEIGIYHYQQIAEFTPDNVKWVDHNIDFPGRIKRENWIRQARALAEGRTTEYSKRFDSGKTPYKK